jgi:hypothetical protein
MSAGHAGENPMQRFTLVPASTLLAFCLSAAPAFAQSENLPDQAAQNQPGRDQASQNPASPDPASQDQAGPNRYAPGQGAQDRAAQEASPPMQGQVAQTRPQDEPAQSGPQNPAMKSPDQNNATNPVAGRNSFTAAQAKSRIEARGYTNVSPLQEDAQGVWRGTATKDGKTVAVSLDYQGNVNS